MSSNDGRDPAPVLRLLRREADPKSPQDDAPTPVVDHMVRALWVDEPPPMDWSRTESALMRRIAAGEGARPTVRSSTGAWRALSFAAAAAVIPLALSLSASAPLEPTAATPHVVDLDAIAAAPAQTGALDLGSLRAGDVVEASHGAVAFADAGRVTWTLAEGSRAVVRSPVEASGLGHVLKLERGSVRVEVAPDLVKDVFMDALAVEVFGTRVAVHGTAFTVSLEQGEVLVDVEHGVVTVGPVGQRGTTTGYQLPAGSTAAFSLDARHGRFVHRPKTSAVAALSARAPDMAPVAAAPTNAAPEAPAPNAIVSTGDVPTDAMPSPARPARTSPNAAPEPAPTESAAPASPAVEPTTTAPSKPIWSTASVLAGLRRCFDQAHPASPTAAMFSVSSTFHLVTDETGAIKSARFTPALPTIQGCATFVFGGRFPSGPATYDIPVQFSR